MESQYDKFLHKIQSRKMRELWDNKEDELWEAACPCQKRKAQ